MSEAQTTCCTAQSNPRATTQRETPHHTITGHLTAQTETVRPSLLRAGPFRSDAQTDRRNPALRMGRDAEILSVRKALLRSFDSVKLLTPLRGRAPPVLPLPASDRGPRGTNLYPTARPLTRWRHHLLEVRLSEARRINAELQQAQDLRSMLRDEDAASACAELSLRSAERQWGFGRWLVRLHRPGHRRRPYPSLPAGLRCRRSRYPGRGRWCAHVPILRW